MSPKFKPRIVLITGCSSGFGLIMSAHLASKGHHVIATMRDLTKENHLISEVQKRGGKVDVHHLDVTDKESIKTVVNSIATKFGYLDALVNNAGYGIGGFFEDLSDEEIRQQMETNFFGVQNVIREVIPLMRPRRSGKIINVSSISGLSGSPCFGAYNASKWALEGFSESLHYELKLFGIDVHCIEPGTYKSEIFYGNAKYAKNFNNKQSPYYEESQHLHRKVMDYVDQCKKDPEELGILVEKLIMRRFASFRNLPDIEAQTMYLLKKILPFRIYSWIINKSLFFDLKKDK